MSDDAPVAIGGVWGRPVPTMDEAGAADEAVLRQMGHRRWPLQIFRAASLVVPPAVAWYVAFSAPHPSRLTAAVAGLLGPLWVLMAGALTGRILDALPRGRRVPGTSFLDAVDVLTASGSSLVWTASIAIAGAVWVGWASLAVVGVMGLCFAELVVLWTLLVARGRDPWRRASLSRRLVPGTAVEGDPVIEELRFTDVRIPTGFRLFAAGRVGPRWSLSRYVLGESGSGGETVMESEVGPAVRGQHRAEPLEVWLEDVFGLCHSARQRAGVAGITVLPRLRPVDGAPALLGRGGADREPRPSRLPTEGALRLREYHPGDDARRIHWVRSLAASQVVVRLPDEVPPDQPAVHVVLDTFLDGAAGLSGTAPAELLDALVKVWLGAARALAEGGARVRLCTAAPAPAGSSAIAPVRRPLSPHTLPAALRLGAEVRWQEALRVGDLVGPGTTVVVSYRLQPDPPGAGTLRWIVVPVGSWAYSDEPLQSPSHALLPHPMGTPENRWSRRRRDRLRRERALRDRSLLLDACAPMRSGASLAGSFSARPAARSRIVLEAL